MQSQAHKHVFKSRSAVFVRLLSDMEETVGVDATKLLVENLKLPTFCAMLMFMYTDTLPPGLLGPGHMNVSVCGFRDTQVMQYEAS